MGTTSQSVTAQACSSNQVVSCAFESHLILLSSSSPFLVPWLPGFGSSVKSKFKFVFFFLLVSPLQCQTRGIQAIKGNLVTSNRSLILCPCQPGNTHLRIPFPTHSTRVSLQNKIRNCHDLSLLSPPPQLQP